MWEDKYKRTARQKQFPLLPGAVISTKLQCESGVARKYPTRLSLPSVGVRLTPVMHNFALGSKEEMRLSIVNISLVNQIDDHDAQ